MTFILMLWQGWRPVYSPEHVYVLAKMIRAHVSLPFRIVLLTDQAVDSIEGVDAILPVPPDPPGLTYSSGPNCYRRLRLFDAQYTAQFDSEWLVSMDIDTLILSDITDIMAFGLSSACGLTMLRAKYTGEGLRPYNGGLMFIRQGAYQHVWDTFDPPQSQIDIKATGWVGSDQSWIGMHCPDVPTIGKEHGAYYVGEYQKRTYDDPPPRIINYAAFKKPWNKPSQKENPELWQVYQDHAGCVAGDWSSVIKDSPRSSHFV